jgi:hypothetical protein
MITLSLDNATKVATQSHTGPNANGIGLADNIQVREEPRTITLLPKLNLKLRLKIRNSALSGPRYIEVLNKPYLHPTGAQPNHSHYICASLAPALFFVNHDVVLSLYTPPYQARQPSTTTPLSTCSVSATPARTTATNSADGAVDYSGVVAHVKQMTWQSREPA